LLGKETPVYIQNFLNTIWSNYWRFEISNFEFCITPNVFTNELMKWNIQSINYIDKNCFYDHELVTSLVQFDFIFLHAFIPFPPITFCVHYFSHSITLLHTVTCKKRKKEIYRWVFHCILCCDWFLLSYHIQPIFIE